MSEDLERQIKALQQKLLKVKDECARRRVRCAELEAEVERLRAALNGSGP